MSRRLFDLLLRRMADEELGPDDPLAVAELHKRLLPYHTCRDRLGFATKAEYDLAVLRLLADEGRVAVAEPALREAVRAEMRHPEPGLAFLHRFAASEVRVRTGAPDGEGAAEESSSGGAGEDAGEGVGASAARSGPTAAVDARTVPSRAEGQPSAERCRECDAALPRVEGARFCPSCGADQTVPTCGECGREMDEDWNYCAFCGARVV
ncbi:MAG: zinc ribbon domain-containing protein [Gemmatimonadota bacterium]